MIEPVLTVRASDVSAAGASDRGRVRRNNEDRFHVDVERGIFLVADGVGGHAAGEVAATTARDVILERLQRVQGSRERRVREAIALANNEIFKLAASVSTCAGMTCVITLALLEEGRLTIGHVGDSRLYMLTPRGIQKLTHDHSPVGEREDAQEISELEAMQHPRRNEVFRDVGSAFHEPEDPDFIEVIETSFDADAAILICSDGLSDMVTAAAIQGQVRQSAGDPAGVVSALIDAANDAGGNDNVTVVYAEGPHFAAPPEDAPAHGATVQRARSGVMTSRLTWLTAGLLGGVVLGVFLGILKSRMPAPPVGGQTLVVGTAPPQQFASIGAALQAARPHDTVAVEHGDYTEQLVLPDGVDLVARDPGTVVLLAPPARTDWVSVTAGGSLGNRLSGIRVVGQPNAPIAIGLQLTGGNVVVDDVLIEGEIGVGIDIQTGPPVLIRSSRFSKLSGQPLRIGSMASPVIRQNLFLRREAGGTAAAVDVAADAAPRLLDNSFVGYEEGHWIRWDPPNPSVGWREALLHSNYTVHGVVRPR